MTHEVKRLPGDCRFVVTPEKALRANKQRERCGTCCLFCERTNKQDGAQARTIA